MTASFNRQPVGLLYASLADPRMTQRSWDRLIDRAREFNFRHSLSSLLMLNDGFVMQWIQGPEHAVQAAWLRIAGDANHHSIAPISASVLTDDGVLRDTPMLLAQPPRSDMVRMLREASQPNEQVWVSLDGFDRVDPAIVALLADPGYHFAFQSALDARSLRMS